MDSSEARALLDWTPRQTIDWYVQNQAWWERVRSGAYRAYHGPQYGGR